MSETPAPTPRAPRRRSRRLIWLAVGVVVLAWCAIAAFQLVQARRHSQRGLDLLESAQHDLGPAQLIRGKGLPRMRQAQGEFDQAASASDSFLLKPFTIL